ncbi:MAG: hypothetical protein KAV41_02610 [Candidatus Pacebacteria bacterium]|nr:hypothetical protein [Candidatus Paceibacterota bacterium]
MIKFNYSEKVEREIFEDFVKKKRPKEIYEMVEKELDETPISKDDNLIRNQLDYIKNNWKKVEDNFYNKLGVFYNSKIKAPNLTCYLTRLSIFPYKYEGENQHFTAPLFGSPAERNRIIMHELCHYFQPFELPKDIKEAVPVILNDHKKFQMFSMDKGGNSEKEQKWRKIIWDIYKKGGTIDDLKTFI